MTQQLSLERPLNAQQFHGRNILKAVPVDGIDAKTMSAKATISTPAIDREVEMVAAGAIDLTNYAGNPVVFFGHQYIPFPIGVSRNKSEQIRIWSIGDETFGECFFSQAFKEAEIVFRLVEERTISATSIAFVPLVTVLLSEDESRALGAKMRVYKHTRVDLTEWSWVGIGMNPEALARHLSLGRVGAVPLTEWAIRTFTPYAEQLKTFGTGGGVGMFPGADGQSKHTNENASTLNQSGADEGNSMTQPNHSAGNAGGTGSGQSPPPPPAPTQPTPEELKTKGETPPVVPPTLPPTTPAPVPTEPVVKGSEPPTAPTQKQKGDDGEGEDGDDSPPPPGAIALQALYTMMKAVVDKADELVGVNEQPDVLEMLNECKETLGGGLGAWATRAAKVYPDIEFDMEVPDGEDKSDDGDEDETDDDESDDEDDDGEKELSELRQQVKELTASVAKLLGVK